MKALITGGAGFIGSHLAERLLGDGWKVVVVDDLSTGSIDNISSLANNPDFSFVQADICKPGVVDCAAAGCDRIYHLAAAVGVQLIVDQPVHTIKTNIRGTEVVLDVARRTGAKVLIASTSEVYGKSEQVPFSEDDDTVLGSTRFSRWSYACSKAIDEFLAFAYHEQYGVKVVIARLFNPIGPRQVGQYGMVVPRFVEKALQNEPISIYGTGEQTRCFNFVGDTVNAIIGLMDGEGTEGAVYNIGSNEEISISDLADMIVSKTKSSSEKVFISYEEAYGKAFDDMMRRVPSLERINKAIGYKSETTLSGTLDIIIDSVQGKREGKGTGHL